MEDNIRGYKQRKYQLKGAGELIEVHGGHIVRSTAQKDRHSKVLTAKGPRDRRVRLSAHTAIQFYDVQDRLGYDRPSKAVDWLMQNAKSAIDQLGQPSPCSAPWDQHSAREPSMLEVKPDVPTSYGFDDRSSCAASFLPPLDAKASVKSFPVAAVIGSSHGNRTPDLLPSGGSRAQGLGLSLQSVHEPISRRAHHPPSRHPVSTTHAFYSESTSLAHSATPVGWPVHNEGMLSFNVTDALCGGGGGAGGAGGEFACNFAFSPHNQSHFTQRESLQSSSLSPDRAWMEPSSPIQQSSFSTAAAGTFTSGAFGGFSGFDMPARFQGEAQQGGISRKLHSASHQ